MGWQNLVVVRDIFRTFYDLCQPSRNLHSSSFEIITHHSNTILFKIDIHSCQKVKWIEMSDPVNSFHTSLKERNCSVRPEVIEALQHQRARRGSHTPPEQSLHKLPGVTIYLDPFSIPCRIAWLYILQVIVCFVVLSLMSTCLLPHAGKLSRNGAPFYIPYVQTGQTGTDFGPN